MVILSAASLRPRTGRTRATWENYPDECAARASNCSEIDFVQLRAYFQECLVRSDEEVGLMTMGPVAMQVREEVTISNTSSHKVFRELLKSSQSVHDLVVVVHVMIVMGNHDVFHVTVDVDNLQYENTTALVCVDEAIYRIVRLPSDDCAQRPAEVESMVDAFAWSWVNPIA